MLHDKDILYRDDQLLVLNKPAGVPVHGSRMLEGRPATLLAMARELTGQMVHAVHRLDRPVSGAILLAFDKDSLAALGSEFENRHVSKSYLPLRVDGRRNQVLWTTPCCRPVTSGVPAMRPGLP